ncbi:hypothetical protein D0Z07_0702 [Hyphodiscus hymeniophilus]|uniref:DNA-directed RNA polymerase III subunit RPC9 n=1 Tax=Hyphodiscus hymeniophilus TaxID=353542 RepID=A0A9P7B0P0_9HELO|nr:hypothetical protein D0Z07_0702 [Hyphodiscus hymeniophilus]
MKILESQNAILTNFEVFQHLQDQRTRYSKKGLKGRRPGNLETVVKELLEYFNEAPSPLASKPIPYNENTMKTLFELLRPYNLAKSELLLILNLRPANEGTLNTVLEEMAERFNDEQQAEMVQIIGDVLGRADGEAERQAMTENAKEARNVEYNQVSQQEEIMEIVYL